MFLLVISKRNFRASYSKSRTQIYISTPETAKEEPIYTTPYPCEHRIKF